MEDISKDEFIESRLFTLCGILLAAHISGALLLHHHICLFLHTCRHLSVFLSPLFNHLHDGLIGLAAEGPKARAA